MFINFEEYKFNDDLTMRNYFALLACILNDNLSRNRSLNLFGISYNDELNSNCKENKKVFEKCKKLRKIKVLDVLNNEEKIFNSVHEAELYTGIKRESIYIYIPRGVLGKRRYKFSYC